MKQFLMAGFMAAGMLVASPLLLAHGGQYRGPGDTTPPGGSGGGGKTPGPGGPSTPGPSGPSTPGPSGPSTPGPSGPTTGGPTGGPGPGRGPTTGKGGLQLEDDLSRWQFWWEFNKDPYINLKQAIHTGGQVTGSDDYFLGRTVKSESKDTLKPSDKDILEKVVPKLIQAITETKQRDIVSSCLVALAKIGKEEDKVIPLMKKSLPENDQEISETAALALGILAKPAGLTDLINIAEDNKDGRTVTGQSNGINYRTRSFAAYGLGLIAYSNADLELKEKVFKCLKGIIEDERMSQRDIKIAAVNGLRLLHVSPQEGQKAEQLYNNVVDTLMTYYEQKKGVEQQAQAHVPTAIATLVGRNLDPKGTLKKKFLKDLEDTKKADWIRQSCAMAIGQMAKPDETEYSKALQDYSKNGKDAQAKYFALISLGQIGGEKNRNFLLEQVQEAKKIDQAWAAIALGVLSFDVRKDDKNADIDRTAGDVVQKQLKLNKNTDVQAGFCVALGLLKYKDGAEDILDLLQRKASDDVVAGYSCIGLGLMGHRAAIDQIKALAQDSVRREQRLKQAAIALGLLGDKTVVDLLVTFLKDKGTSLASQAAIASALGYIGDARSIEPLVEMLHNKELTELARAFAAVALGIVADKEEYPWNSKIAVNLNYRANTETLTNQATGILDIL